MVALPNHSASSSAQPRGSGHGPADYLGTFLRFSQEAARVVAMTTPADRVRELVVSSGVSQGDYAQSIGLDPTKLSKSLSGARRFSSLDLARIAERSQVTVDWLLTGAETPLATAARASRGSSTELALAEAGRLVELRESAARLGYGQPWAPVPSRSEARRAVSTGAALAGEALARLSAMDFDPVVLDLATVVEKAFGVDVAITSLGDGFDGLAVATDGVKLILAALTPVAFRLRFTIAHELGHLLAGDDQGVHLDRDVYARGDNSERRANAFAAAFLMPEPTLRARVLRGFDQVAFASLAVDLMVSPSSLAIRLRDLRLIDSGAAAAWQGMSAAQAARLAGAAEAMAAATAYSTEPRRPGLLSRDLFAAYLDERTTLRPYANLLGVDTVTLRAELERSREVAG